MHRLVLDDGYFIRHENGTVNIWRTNALSWQPWITCHTAIYFEGFESEPSALSDDGDPEDGAPLRKVNTSLEALLYSLFEPRPVNTTHSLTTTGWQS